VDELSWLVMLPLSETVTWAGESRKKGMIGRVYGPEGQRAVPMCHHNGGARGYGMLVGLGLP
jgi:hypothetical protein